MPYRLGVDLGTTFTAAAVANGTPPSMIGLGSRHALAVPSVLFLAEDGFVVGETAERRGAQDPQRLVREFKRRLGDHVPLIVAGSPFSAEVLTARLLQWVVARVSQQSGEPPSEVIVTHPANWGPYKMEVLGQVVELADIGPTSWCPEPVAAAVQYASRSPVADGTLLAVYDFGGGTFDACVLEKTGHGFSVLGTPDGVEHLGGIDLDETIFRLVLDSIVDQVGDLDADDPATRKGLLRLRRECVSAKEDLSEDVDTVVDVAVPGLTTTFRVTRAEFERLIRPAIGETVRALRRALRSASIEASALDRIVLIGGSSQIPLVSAMLHDEFAVATAADTHPKHDVALGALRLGRAWAASAAAAASAGTPAHLDAAETPDPTRTPESSQTPASTEAPSLAGPGAQAEPPVPSETSETSETSESTEAPAHPIWADPPPGPTQLRRERVLLGVVALAAVVVVIMVLVVVNLGRSRGPDTTLAAGPTTPTNPSTSASPTPTPVPIPRSAPLTGTQLIVSMEADKNWNLYLADTTESAPLEPLVSSPKVDISPTLSPDLASMIYNQRVSNRATSLRLAAVDGTGDRPLFDPVPSECALSVYRPAWHPIDGNLLAVPCSAQEGQIGLYLMRLDGTMVRKIAVDADRVGDPTFSPDGTQLVFWGASGKVSGDEGDSGGALYLVATDGSGPAEQLTKPKLVGQDRDAVWSPTEDVIAFRRRTGEKSAQIVSMDVGGPRKVKTLTRGVGIKSDPSWSPTGDQIAFKSSEPTKVWPGKPISRVWVMDADGDDRRVLWTEEASFPQGAPSWSRR